MNDHEKVLPCPFCGSENISDGEMLTEKDCGTRVKQSQCNECGAFGPEAVTDGPDYGDVRAIAAWNRRAAIEVMEGKGEVVGYLRRSALEALLDCRDDDANGYAHLWMRPVSEDSVPVYALPTPPQPNEEKGNG